MRIMSDEDKFYMIFAMAKIQRIGHDHQAPFWVVLVAQGQAVTRGENKLPHGQSA